MVKNKVMHIVQKLSALLLLLAVINGFLSSCGSRRHMVYVQEDSTKINTLFEQFIPRIQPNDVLTISVTAADPKVTAPFNLVNTSAVTATTQLSDMALRPTYTVDSDGNIRFPKLGKVRLAGLTRLQAMEHLRGRLEEYIHDPGVNMSINNFRVSVLGEVARPGSFTFPTERVTIFEALGNAGDMTIRGIRKNVLVIREVDGKKTMNRIDLTKKDAVNSPFYYLAQNDVVYVEPNKSQINNSKLGANTNIIISIASLMITVISVLTR